MRTSFRLAFLVAVVASVTGCRFKGYEGFSKATSPNPIDYSKVKGDPYGNGGIADASGGLNPATRYGMGARKNGQVLPSLDQPNKGSGQQPGEFTNASQSNSPALQPSPSDVGR